ncbi:MAG TPA: arginine--tRNA ligase [Acidimicrobiales bacterium]|nr:arginine--tRNA ligase [Acidimicrobiales bacterium]
MPDPALVLSSRLRRAIHEVTGRDADPVLRRSASARFGDYQANFAMAMAKEMGRNPRDLATEVVSRLDVAGVCSAVEVAGPGFVNLTVENSRLAVELSASAADAHLGVPFPAETHTYVVDYGGPNVAKEMHVGHLRSAVIGDSVARILEWSGHRVVRQDHLGDWGTQFGMLIEYLWDEGWRPGDAAGSHTIGDLNQLYREAQDRFRSDPQFADRARRRVAALQSGDADTVAVWEELVAESRRHFEAVYRRLRLTLSPGDVRPESFYNPMLEPLATELEQKGLARIDQGALCCFPPGFTNRDGDPQPLIVRYSAGGYGYEATDLAGVRYSVDDLGADRLAYVVDARQAQHFAMVFAVARQAGWLPDGVEATHVAFGTILGPDGRPFRTRAGDTVKLSALLDEAVARAARVVDERSRDLSDPEKAEVAEAVAVGSLKYNDLSSDRVKDEIFDWDRMLATEGNTAPYLQYAHARIQSIFRRAETDVPDAAPIHIAEPAERDLALAVLGFGAAVEAAAEGYAPHRLCAYLFDLASTFTRFYETCPVLRTPDPAVRASRLMLCRVTADTLRTGLGLLGVDAPQRM